MSDIFMKLKLKKKDKGANPAKPGEPRVSVKKRRHVAIISTIIVGIIGTLFIMSMNGASKLYKYTNEMQSTLSASKAEYGKNMKLDATYEECMERMASSLAGYVAFYFSENGYDIFTREEITEQLGDYVFIYYYHGFTDSVESVDNGYVLSDGKLKYELDSVETYELLKNGTYIKGKRHFTAHAVDSQSYAILAWGMDDIFTRKSILGAYASDSFQYVYRINEETKIIEDSSEVELIGTSYDEKFTKIGEVEYDGDTYSIVYIEGKGACFEVEGYGTEGMRFVSYIPLLDLRYDYASGVFLPCIFLWAFLILLLVYYVRFIKRVAEEKGEEIEYVHIWGKWYGDGKLISHSMGLVLFASIVTVLAVFYFQTLLNYSDQDTTANSNLNSFMSFLDNAQENSEIMDEDFLDMQLILCNAISDYYLKHQYLLTEDNVNTMNRFMDTVSGITIYDNKGTIEYDTGNNMGYTLAREENSLNAGDHNIWGLIDGTTNSIGYYDYNTGLYYAGCRRQDKNGAVLIRVDYSNVFDVLQLMNPQETLKTADFGVADRILIQSVLPDTMYVANSATGEVTESSTKIDENVDVDGFSGVIRRNGKRFFVNTKKNDKYTVMSAVRTSFLYGVYNTRMFICLLITFALQELIFIFISMHRREEAPDNAVEIRNNPFLSQTLESQTMDKRFRGTLRNMTIMTALLTVMQMISDSIWSDNPVITYLFSSQWPKGMNLFSLTMIIIIIIVGLLGGVIFNGLLVFFTKSMGPRGLTIGKMMGSLIKFLDLIIVITLCVRQVGFETSTVLAGAGIVGGLTLFCAQATVNDMLCGFFLVFENQFNIGDWITIDDFRGQVVEIGIRTTRLQKQETFKVFNNSEVKKFKIAEYWDRGAIVNVDIAYKENAAKAIKLITDNVERYRKEIPYITDGPKVVGVEDLGASGVTLGIRAIANVEKAITTEREIRRVTKELFDENGIEIPFTQVTLHMGDEMVSDMGRIIQKND